MPPISPCYVGMFELQPSKVFARFSSTDSVCSIITSCREARGMQADIVFHSWHIAMVAVQRSSLLEVVDVL